MYDALDRVAEIQYNSGSNGAFVTVYTYKYDSAGNLHSVTDTLSGQVTVYRYDVESKLISSYVYDAETYLNLYGTAVTYDDMSRVDTVTQSYDYASPSGTVQDALIYSYEYSGVNGNISSFSVDGDTVTAYMAPVYDNFGRMTSKIVGMQISDTDVFFNRLYWDYVSSGILYPQESASVYEYTSQVYRSSSDTAAVSSVTYRYTYDENGNITQITDTSGNIKYKYTYDDLGQLVREDNAVLEQSYVFTYDNAGNITSKKTYAYTTGTLGTELDSVSYTYGDSEWADLLTKYGNTNITYDTIGNPLTIGTATLTWQGRQLMSYTDNGATVSYTYNADGIRTSKTIASGSTTTKHEYILSGSQIVRETVYFNDVEQYTLVYFYDETGSPIGMKYREPTYADGVFDGYIFEKNLQGDIVAIYDLNTNKIVEYKYDAWGNFTVEGTAANTIGILNSFRYRGYYYDNETNLYYLQSRYYNSNWGRFINADGYVSTGVGILGNNMFAYCNNSPIICVDSEGQFPWLVVGVVAFFAVMSTINYFVARSYPDGIQLIPDQSPDNESRSKFLYADPTTPHIDRNELVLCDIQMGIFRTETDLPNGGELSLVSLGTVESTIKADYSGMPSVDISAMASIYSMDGTFVLRTGKLEVVVDWALYVGAIGGGFGYDPDEGKYRFAPPSTGIIPSVGIDINYD